MVQRLKPLPVTLIFHTALARVLIAQILIQPSAKTPEKLAEDGPGAGVPENNQDTLMKLQAPCFWVGPVLPTGVI